MRCILVILALCTLGTKLSSAREYLGIDAQSLQQLEHNKNVIPARRYTKGKNDVHKATNYLKKAIKTLQSYKDDELRNVIKNFKKSLNNMKVEDKAFGEAKKFVLDHILSQTNGKSGKQIKQLSNDMYKALEKNAYKDVLGHNPAIFEQLMSKLLKGINRNRVEDSDILGAMKKELQKIASDLVVMQKRSEENAIKLAMRIMNPGVSAESDDFVFVNNPRKRVKPVELLKDEAVKLALSLFSNARTPALGGQINFQIDGMDEDSGLTFSF